MESTVRDPVHPVGTWQRHLRRFKRTVYIGLPVITGILALLAVLGLYDITAPYRYRMQLIDRLEAVSDRVTVASAVGPLGVILDHPDGSWTAITYKDAHNFGFPSIAVARTSNGRWFDSREHHCGLFMIYARVGDEAEEHTHITPEQYWEMQDPRIALLHQIEHEPDSVRRETLLSELGFHVFQ